MLARVGDNSQIRGCGDSSSCWLTDNITTTHNGQLVLESTGKITQLVDYMLTLKSEGVMEVEISSHHLVTNYK